MTGYVLPGQRNWRQGLFPRTDDNLLIKSFPAVGREAYVHIDHSEISMYDYATTAAVTGAAASDFGTNLINGLIQQDGHLLWVVPTIMPENVVFGLTAPGTGAANASILADNDSNTRVMGVTNTGSNGVTTVIVAQESPRAKLNLPAQVVWYGLDAQSTGGWFDWLSSSPESPNPAFGFLITDVVRAGTIQMRFEMPANNLSATTGMTARVRFYAAFMQYHLLPTKPEGPITVFDAMPPTQGSASGESVAANIRQTPSASRPMTY